MDTGSSTFYPPSPPQQYQSPYQQPFQPPPSPPQQHHGTFQQPMQQQPDPKPATSTAMGQSPPRPSTPTPSAHPSYLAPKTEFILDWSLKVLGVAAAILFGIWAPISYKVTADGNSDNGASQKELISSIDALSLQAWSAAALQTEAASSLDELKSRMDDIGSLRVWEFCESRTADIVACDDVVTSMAIGDAISSLAGLTPTFASPTLSASRTISSTGAPGTAAPPSSGSSKGGNAHIALPAILGIVFAALAVIGAILGVIAWRLRVKRERRGKTARSG
ncbi:hypothetical protein BDV96DRAFT_584030 [Lophiotrema nucula]|uniref:Uncharacterized protein n=1 Tax=Lophiotrema nucula TaxID=690887 RepID=A0A6A5YTV9_9PLEO|nr:hypothetical protein BDV96DRAFT_584030 [Lophiotrema nucula]